MMVIRSQKWDEPKVRAKDAPPVKGRRALRESLRLSPFRRWLVPEQPMPARNARRGPKRIPVEERMRKAAEILKADRANLRFLLGDKARPNTFAKGSAPNPLSMGELIERRKLTFKGITDPKTGKTT